MLICYTTRICSTPSNTDKFDIHTHTHTQTHTRTDTQTHTHTQDSQTLWGEVLDHVMYAAPDHATYERDLQTSRKAFETQFPLAYDVSLFFLPLLFFRLFGRYCCAVFFVVVFGG